MKYCQTQLFLSLLAGVLATDVVTTLRDFEKIINNDGATIVRYGTAWCRHCKTMSKEWETFQTVLTHEDVTLVDVDCTLNNEICVSNEIYRFPSIILYEDGEVAFKFPDFEERTAENFQKMLSSVQHPIESYGNDEVIPLMSGKTFSRVTTDDSHVTLVIFCDDMCDSSLTVFDQLATQIAGFNGAIRLASVNCDDAFELCSQENIHSMPSFIFYVEGRTERQIGERSAARLLADIEAILGYPNQGRSHSRNEQSPGKLDYYSLRNSQPAIVVNIGPDLDQTYPNLEQQLDETDSFGRAPCSAFRSEANPDFNDCWVWDSARLACFLKDDAKCIDVNCQSTQITGFINPQIFTPKELIGDEESGELIRNVQLGGAECTYEMVYDPKQQRYKFTFTLGECNMKARAELIEREGKIVFKQTLEFSDPAPVIDGDVPFFGHLHLRCAYQTAVSTTQNFDTSIKPFHHAEERRGTWDESFDISFSLDDEYAREITADELYIGQKVYAKVFPSFPVGPNFPLRYYLNRCAIRSGKQSFSIIENGCLSDLVQTQILSDDIYQREEIKLSFVSFAFVEELAKYTMSIKCDIILCIKEDIEQGRCGVGTEAGVSCLEGYTQYSPPNPEQRLYFATP